MSRVVRSSKFRHVFGTAAKPEDSFQNLNVTRSAWDTNFIKANPKFFAVIWESAGGGSLAVMRIDEPGKIRQDSPPLLSAHKGAVLDMDWHPFNDNIIASVAEDANVMLWGIPDEGIKAPVNTPLQTLQGHKRKVGTCNFNPVANNVLLTTSHEVVKIWDVEAGKELVQVDGHTDIIQAIDWNHNGSLAASTCKDKKLRLFDPRTRTIGAETNSHQGVKGSRVCWLKDKVLTVGFSKSSEREFYIYDHRSLVDPIAKLNIDNASGGLMPFFDPDTSILYLAGKGDGNIRYYEIVDEAPYYHYLTEYKSAHPQRGMAFLPKRAVNVTECEIARAFKLHANKMEPITFRVPRKSDIFQDDLYPDTYAGIPSLSADQWLEGQNAEPKLTSLSPGFVQKEKPTTEFKPVAQVVEGPKTEAELRTEYEKLKNRVSYLESELVKKDARIKELETA